MQTLHTRLDPVKEEVLWVVETYGIFRAMRDFKVASYDRFRIWLKEATGNENFGIFPKISPSNNQPLGDQLVEAFLRKVAYLETKLREKNQRIASLEWQLDLKGEKEPSQASALLEVCLV